MKKEVGKIRRGKERRGGRDEKREYNMWER